MSSFRRLQFGMVGTQILALVMVLAALAAMPRMAQAQSQTTGGIGGLVIDASHAAIPGATVTARNTGTDVTTTAKSDASGRFLVRDLAPGNYEVTVNASNFSPYKVTVAVEVGLVTTADAAMAVGAQTQTVEVTGEAPVIDTEQSQFATDINKTDIDNLPINARRWSYFVLDTPGDTPDGTFGDISYRGIGYIFDNNTVDGSSNTQAFFVEETGRTRMAYSTSLESIDEFQVSTSNYSAEYGRSVGGVVNAVTKSGSNQMHGDLYYFNRDNTFAGAFNPWSTGAVYNGTTYTTVPIKPLDIRQQMGADVGGALIKDKLFWYFDWDAMIHHFPTTAIPSSPANFFAPIVVALPTTCNTSSALATYSGSNVNKNLTTGQDLACRGFTQTQVNNAFNVLAADTGTVPRTGDQTIAFPKIDWHPEQADSVSVSYNRVRWASPYGVQTASVVARGLDSQGNDYVNDDRYVADWTRLLGNNVNNLRFVWSRDFEFEDSTPSIPGSAVSPLTGLTPEVDFTTSSGCGYNAGTAVPCGWVFGAPYYTPRIQYPNERRTEVSDTFSFNKGRHLMKVGASFSRPLDTLDAYSSGMGYGDYFYSTMQDYLSDYISYEANPTNPQFACQTNTAAKGSPAVYAQIPCYADYEQSFGQQSFNIPTLDSGYFFQDDFHYSSHLTLNLGIRLDQESFPGQVNPNPLVPQTQSFPTDTYSIAGLAVPRSIGPRLGFSWNPVTSMVLHGGWGLYYGLISNEQVYGMLTLSGGPNGQYVPELFPTTGTSNDVGSPTPGVPTFPNTLTSYPNTATGATNVVFFSPDLHLPAAEEYDLAWQYQIANNTSVSISYLGSGGRYLPVGIDTNLPPSSTLNYTIVGGPLAGQTVTYPYFTGTRPNPNYLQMTEYCSCANSRYNAAVFQYTRRMTGGLQAELNYTYSHAEDDGAQDSAEITGNSGSLNPQDLGLDWGTSSLNVRHRFTGAVVWMPNYFNSSSNKFLKAGLDGWIFSVNETAQTGQPYSATVSGSAPSALITVAKGTGPTGGDSATRAFFMGKNNYTYPALYNTDSRLGRNFALTEKMTLQVTAEAFNIFNHDNITSETTTLYTAGGTATAPTLTYGNSAFGVPTNGNNSVFFGPRQLQFGAKLSF